MPVHLDEEQFEAVSMSNENKQPIVLEYSETLLIESFSVGTRDEPRDFLPKPRAQ
jgi:hypothetical protein